MKITEFNKLGLQYLDFPAHMNEINRQFSRNQDWHDQPVQDVERIVMCCPTEPGETFNTSERPLVQLPVTVENLKQSGMAWEMLYKDRYEHCPDDTVVYNNTFFQKNVKGKSWLQIYQSIDALVAEVEGRRVGLEQLEYKAHWKALNVTTYT